MFGMGPMEMGLAVLAILLLFGAKRIPEIAGSFGKGIKEFKKNMNDVQRDIAEPSAQESLLRATQNVAHDESPAAEPKRLI